MIKTPITKKAFDRVQLHKIEALNARRRVNGWNGFFSKHRGILVLPLVMIVGSYVVGALFGSRSKSVRKVDEAMVPIKSSTALLFPLLGKALALITVRQKIKKIALEQADEVSATSESEGKPSHS